MSQLPTPIRRPTLQRRGLLIVPVILVAILELLLGVVRRANGWIRATLARRAEARRERGRAALVVAEERARRFDDIEDALRDLRERAR